MWKFRCKSWIYDRFLNSNQNQKMQNPAFCWAWNENTQFWYLELLDNYTGLSCNLNEIIVIPDWYSNYAVISIMQICNFNLIKKCNIYTVINASVYLLLHALIDRYQELLQRSSHLPLPPASPADLHIFKGTW